MGITWDLVLMITMVFVGVYVCLKFVTSINKDGITMKWPRVFLLIAGSMLLATAFILWMEIEIIVMWLVIFAILYIILVILSGSDTVRGFLFGRP